MLLTKSYDRERAVTYARVWANARNPLFINFTGQGGDCTNFVSQAILAGCCTMNYTRDFGWYYRSIEDRAPAWTGVSAFYDFLTQAPDFLAANGGVGPFGREVSTEEVLVGDVIQLANEEGRYYHTVIVTGFDAGDILISAHSNDALDRPLSTYNYAALRYLHIDGIAVEVPLIDCYEALLNGRAILSDEGAGDTPPLGDVPLVPLMSPSALE